MIRASDLAGKPVRRENGELLGDVFEIRIQNSKVSALICGARGFFQRLTGSVAGHRVDWSQVRQITPSQILIADGSAKKLRRRRPRRKPST
jgi:sporulation protein YlmC with PRC-barrel domain